MNWTRMSMIYPPFSTLYITPYEKCNGLNIVTVIIILIVSKYQKKELWNHQAQSQSTAGDDPKHSTISNIQMNLSQSADIKSVYSLFYAQKRNSSANFLRGPNIFLLELAWFWIWNVSHLFDIPLHILWVTTTKKYVAIFPNKPVCVLEEVYYVTPSKWEES